MEKTQRYKELFSRYKNLPDEELLKILNGDDYQQIAKEVATDILNSDRKEYYHNIQEQEKTETEYRLKIESTENHPLYNEIHQIAGDLRFLKNLIIIALVLGIILIIISVFVMI